LRGTWSSYFLNTDGVILVVDSTDRERTPIVREELGKLLVNEELKQACILVFANKQDLREAMTAAEISENLQLHAIRTHEVKLFPFKERSHVRKYSRCYFTGGERQVERKGGRDGETEKE
jgi:GTPase SAR1 family protein